MPTFARSHPEPDRSPDAPLYSFAQRGQEGDTPPPPRRLRPRLVLLTVVLVVLGLWAVVRSVAWVNDSIGAQQRAANGIAWHDRFDQAAAVSAQTGKPIFLDFTADWCPPCQVMEESVFSDPAVIQTITAGFVPMRVDLSRNAAPAVALAQDREVDVFPTLILLDPQGREIDRHLGALTRDQMLAWLTQVQFEPAADTSRSR